SIDSRNVRLEATSLTTKPCIVARLSAMSCSRTVELTWRRESKHLPPNQASCETRSPRSGPTTSSTSHKSASWKISDCERAGKDLVVPIISQFNSRRWKPPCMTKSQTVEFSQESISIVCFGSRFSVVMSQGRGQRVKEVLSRRPRFHFIQSNQDL